MGQMLCCAADPNASIKNANESAELSINDDYEKYEDITTREVSKKSASPFAILSDESPNPEDIRPLAERKNSIGFKTRNTISVYHEELKNWYYIEDKIIGEGSFGLVRKVIHIATGHERAVKSIDKDVLGKNIEPDINEVNILKTLDHPNIIKIYDIFVAPKKYHIIMELITGRDIHDFIKNHSQLSEQDISNWMFKILEGIAYCHFNGVIHMDIKPDNIMFQNEGPDPVIKIVDFGLSRIKSTQNKPGMGNGKPVYKAPEVLDGIISAKADVWSCGVLLYWLLSHGSFPFEGSNNDMTRHIIKHGELIFPEKSWNWVTEGAKDLIRQMLTKDPDKRLSAEEAFKHKWVQGFSNIPQIDPVFMQDAFDRLVKFKSYLTIRHAALEYISSHYSVSKDLIKLQKFFLDLDKNHDGSLSKEELSEAVRKLRLRKKTDIQELIETLDTDRSGQVDYSEFITGALKWEKNMTKQKLEAAFKAFDLDKNGEIDIDELKQVLGDNEMVDEATWDKILSEADLNHDGKIQLSEFESALKANYLDGLEEKDLIIAGLRR